MGSGASGDGLQLSGGDLLPAVGDRQEDTPKPAITKRFIISVESSSMEMRISSSTGSSHSFRRVRVLPFLGQQEEVLDEVGWANGLVAASGWRAGTIRRISSR